MAKIIARSDGSMRKNEHACKALKRYLTVEAEAHYRDVNITIKLPPSCGAEVRKKLAAQLAHLLGKLPLAYELSGTYEVETPNSRVPKDSGTGSYLSHLTLDWCGW